MTKREENIISRIFIYEINKELKAYKREAIPRLED